MDIKEMKRRMENVPFGNSQFQIVNFIANQDSPERAYRNILLQLSQKLNAMHECSFKRRERELDIKEIDFKLETAEGIARERLLLDREKAEFYLDNEIKLINDCAIEIATYEKLLSNLPDFSREDFEKSESEYWKTRLIKDAQLDIKSVGTITKGTMQALDQIGIEVKRNDKGGFMTIERQKDPDLKILKN